MKKKIYAIIATLIIGTTATLATPLPPEEYYYGFILSCETIYGSSEEEIDAETLCVYADYLECFFCGNGCETL